MKSRWKSVAFASTVFFAGFCWNALAQTGRAEQAVALLKLTMACPHETQNEVDRDNNVNARKVTRAEYLGDATTFKGT